ncbi:MAG TPA: EscU/YscU/HrcU family type III secretion system export apparatus switch protein, partial [Rubrivivax sp.]|nr:EscU/YscU/HrcU family type III secretion system export apparatus switch protein [Rubrivivax sp.]
MADSSAQDKKLPASQRKIDKARGDGQVARSRDLGHFAALTAGVALLAGLAPEICAWLERLLAQSLRFDATLVAQPMVVGERVWSLTVQMLLVLLPLFATMVLVAIGGSVLAGGWNFTVKPLVPKFSKVN